ncbi:putative extracellular nuclease [Synechococcus sp. PCC 7502]|uniref:lamin tail domain-containing protein n=1 Tax=Synechococcus sp. PCC 7502 TaxID=1173263 RepID=UPI00029F9733|nr:lamin tail domain-containing protein [Synechococcus sp. PCC 7502]AFY73355.1 putative extracellular nuclease [Synechococcus sp. PCC 7502]
MATTLSSGDIAFLSLIADNPDTFSFVLLKDIDAGTIINVTDNGFLSSGSLRTGEGVLQYVAASALTVGTVITYIDGTSNTNWTNVSGGTSFALSTSGDSLIAFQGTLTGSGSSTTSTNPTFLAAVTINRSTFDANAADSNTTALPTGLTDGVNAVAVGNTSAEFDNARYTGPTSFASVAEARTAINTTSNWTKSNSDTTNFSGTFTIGAVTPTVNLSVSSNAGTEAGTTQITVTATASGAVTGAQTVNLGVTGTGISTGDYNLSNTTITIPDGQTQGSVTFTIVDDAAIEGTETAILTISNPSGGITLGNTTTQNIAIADNESAIQITEYMYNPSSTGGEFVEFTNLGTSTVDFAGWSFDDNSRTAGSFSLSAFGIVQAGESVILTESDAAAFRTAWNLPNTVKVIGGLNQNLGRADEINVYDASNNLVDRLTYGDQTYAGTIRTQGFSGWTPITNLEPTTINTSWQLSAVNDAQNSQTSANGDVGNPGVYNLSAGVNIFQSGGITNITEGGATDTYNVVLRTQPASNVTIAINGGTQTTNNPSTLTFTSANWFTPQTVTVSAVDDSVFEGNHTGTITFSTTSSDANYNNITINSVTANITDNDQPGAAPTIQVNTTTTTNFLDGGSLNSLPVSGSGLVSGVINDPTDPAKNFGIDFAIADTDTPVGNLTVTVTSNNQSVVTDASLTSNLTGTGATRNLKINPVGVGLANITVTVSDGAQTSTYIINYAASAASVNPSTTRFLTGAANASTAIAIDANYMLVADDENQGLRLYDRQNSGLPLNSFDFTSSLGLTDLSGGIPREVDIEASAKLGNRIFWLGSESNSDSGNSRPNRDRIFGTDISGSGANTTLSFAGRYDYLREDIINWDKNNVHGLGANFFGLDASAASGVGSKQSDGYNIEGLVFAPDNITAYVSFRAPQEPTSGRTKALIVPVTNFTSLLSSNNGGTLGSATFGAPIQLDLGGRGIREIAKNANNQYVIIAGPAGDATGVPPFDFRLYTWTGNAADTPVLRSANLTALNSGGSFESIVSVPDNLDSNSQIQLLVDNGTTDFYNTGLAGSDIPDKPNFQKSRSEIVTIGAPQVAIHDIQGAAHISPLVGQNVTGVAGIVTALRSNGFYFQDPNPDNNDATSEAIFVFTSSAPTVAIGDSILVNGKVSEFRPGNNANNLTTTEITSPSITKLSSGNALPTATILGNGGRTIPTSVIENDATNVETSGIFDPAQDGIDFYESLEGMRVQINNAVSVSPTNNFGEIWVLSDNGANATGKTARGGIGLSANDFNPERIQIDPALLTSGSTANLNLGTTFNTITGVVDYSFSNFEVLPTSLSVATPSTLQKEVTNLAPTANQLTVATFNVENLDIGDGAAKFNALASQIVNNLKSPDIINLQEIQDNNGATNNGVVDASTTLQTLINAIAAAGGPTYQFRQVNPVDGTNGGEPGGNIRPAFLFNPNRVSFVDIAGGTSTSNTTVTNVSGVPTLSASSGLIDPTNSAFDSSRKPLVGQFTFNGQSVYVIDNHFNSKGGDQPLYGPNQPPVLSSEVQRNQQATIVKNFVRDILNVNPNANVIVAGDLNDFSFSNPLNILKSAGLTDLVSTLPANEQYDYVFEGNSQDLDHILASGNLVNNLDGVDVVHVNSEFASQTSDHDPILARFNIASNLINGTPGRDTLIGTSGNDIITGYQGADTLTGGLGSDKFVFTSTKDGKDTITDFTSGADQIVLTSLFQSAGLSGLNYTNAISQGYLSFGTSGNDTNVLIDLDGFAGSAFRSAPLVTVQKVNSTTLASSSNFVF